MCEGRMDRERFHNSEKMSRCWANTEHTAQKQTAQIAFSGVTEKWMQSETLSCMTSFSFSS